MTGQWPDEFRYQGIRYDLVGMSGSGLYTPMDFGMAPFSSCTACWRGYILRFDCVDDALILDGMDINIREPATINGVEPQVGQEHFKYTYSNIGLKTHYTGTILLAKDFIQKIYVHMGFQRPMAYRTVIELAIDDGNILEVRDLSARMAEMRKQDPTRGAHPKRPDDIEGWIEKTFSLDYESE